MKTDSWWKIAIIIFNIAVLILQFFISRTLSQYDATNQDHEMRLREVERMAQNNAAMNQRVLELNEKTFEIVQVYMSGVKDDIIELKADIREIKTAIK